MTLETNNLPRVKNDPELMQRLKEIVVRHRFSKLSGWTEETGWEDFASEIDAHAFKRHDDTIQLFLPWVWQVCDLKGTRVVEIGCGTGSSAAAFSPYVGEVIGYDIEEMYATVARERIEAHGFNNVEIIQHPPEVVNQRVRDRHRTEQADVVLLFAVLEHQTIPERIDTLQMVKEILKPGGIVVIGETPNRLTYVDRHTSQLPFFNQLPPEMRALYYDRSKRKNFTDSIESFLAKKPRSKDDVEEYFIRWGDAVSYHEFELVFPDIHDTILTDGFHPNIQRTRGVKEEDALLDQAFELFTPHVHKAFTIHYLDFVFRPTS